MADKPKAREWKRWAVYNNRGFPIPISLKNSRKAATGVVCNQLGGAPWAEIKRRFRLTVRRVTITPEEPA